MKRRAPWQIVIVCSLCLFGCRKADDRAPVQAPPADAPSAKASDAPAPNATDTATAAPAPTTTAPVDWSQLVGKCVVAEGYAGGGPKTGLHLEGGTWSIGVVLEPAAERAWKRLPAGSRVRVRGVVASRADRPVFIQKPGELPKQGIPVPEGTDLEAARRRLVIENATVSPVRSAKQVEAALGAAVGTEVSLPGVVWSVNGLYWFNHDGVDLHVEGTEAFAEWKLLHGKPVALSGRLERRAMPRIDQFVMKPKPDLADAYVIVLKKIAPHPQLPVTPCPS